MATVLRRALHVAWAGLGTVLTGYMSSVFQLQAPARLQGLQAGLSNLAELL